MSIKIHGKHDWLFRTVDQDGYELDVMVQPRRKKKATTRFLNKILEGCLSPFRIVVAGKLKSYQKSIKALLSDMIHRQHKGLNNRVENARQPTRRRENK